LLADCDHQYWKELMVREVREKETIGIHKKRGKRNHGMRAVAGKRLPLAAR
jgi:DNA-binding IclR family transcriptional regulator